MKEDEIEDRRTKRLKVNATKKRVQRKAEKETEVEEHKAHRAEVDNVINIIVLAYNHEQH